MNDLTRAPRVLVVEDDEDIARLISHNLQASGFEVQSFVSGISVLTEAVRELPSLFLLDVMLPGTDGFELCRQIRQTPALSAVPIIFLTAKTSEADRVKGLELGGDDYITKPFSPRELVARIRTVLRDMLDLIHQGFSTLNLECARKVLQMDKEIDRVCHALFHTHLAETVPQGDTSGFEILLMAQALERAGDHTTNLAEDLYSLIEGRSLRHVPKKKAAN